jgi:hypothetical protein
MYTSPCLCAHSLSHVNNIVSYCIGWISLRTIYISKAINIFIAISATINILHSKIKRNQYIYIAIFVRPNYCIAISTAINIVISIPATTNILDCKIPSPQYICCTTWHLNKILLRNVDSEDLRDRPCNCPGRGSCRYNNVCRKALIVYKVTIPQTRKYYIGATSQTLKKRMVGHLQDTRKLLKDGVRSSTLASHLAQM